MVKKSSGKAAPAKKRAATRKPSVTKPVAVESASTSVAASASFESLQKWNFVAAGLLFAQAVLLLVFGATKSYPVFAGFLARDPLQSSARGETVLTFAIHHLFDINLAYLMAAVLAFAALVYLLMATAWRPRVEAGLTLGRNPRRWYTGALVGGLTVLAVALLVGVQDVALLAAVFGLTAVFYVAESVAERRGRYALRTMAVGKFAGLLAWAVVALYILFGLLYGSALSAYVYAITGALYVSGFAAVSAFSWQQYKAKGRWADRLLVERAYLVQNILMLSVLTWLLFVGVFR